MTNDEWVDPTESAPDKHITVMDGIWRPIATAREQKDVLVGYRGRTKRIVARLDYYPVAYGATDKDTVCEWGWIDTVHGDPIETPTHWQILPDPPASDAI